MFNTQANIVSFCYRKRTARKTEKDKVSTEKGHFLDTVVETTDEFERLF